MKRPTINDYPQTDARTFKSLDGSVDWKKYAEALEEYADSLSPSPQPSATAEEIDIEGREFYELMQQYRFAPMSDQDRTVKAFEAVKHWIRQYAAKPVAEDRTVRDFRTVAEREVSDEEIEKEFPTDLLVICKQQSILPKFDADQGDYLGALRDSNQDKQFGAKWMRKLLTERNQ